MKILLVGEYSNVHATLAEGLRGWGHQVTVVSNGDFWKNYPRDIDVARPEGRLGGLRLLTRLYRLLPQMKGYDVVQLLNVCSSSTTTYASTIRRCFSVHSGWIGIGCIIVA